MAEGAYGGEEWVARKLGIETRALIPLERLIHLLRKFLAVRRSGLVGGTRGMLIHMILQSLIAIPTPQSFGG
jgi:hypothetical protein